jgi:hypothetical protein
VSLYKLTHADDYWKYIQRYSSIGLNVINISIAILGSELNNAYAIKAPTNPNKVAIKEKK